jgi:ribosomal protein S18 acetylase RimI-like enzyme
MSPDGLVATQGLSANELDAINELADICNAHDHGNLKLNRDMLATRPRDATNDFLYYADGLLVGFLPLFTFNAIEAEVSGMVHPAYRRRGIFTVLYHAARRHCENSGFQRMLFMVERSSEAGQAFVAQIGATYQHSEYLMTLTTPQPVPAKHPTMQLRPATRADAPTIVHILMAAFHDPDDNPERFAKERMSDPASEWLLASDGDAPFGTLCLFTTTQETFIFAFGVLPAYQGQGYGAQILGLTIAKALATQPQRVLLEVATENANALRLYTRCGFEQTTTYDYAMLRLAQP